MTNATDRQPVASIIESDLIREGGGTLPIFDLCEPTKHAGIVLCLG